MNAKAHYALVALSAVLVCSSASAQPVVAAAATEFKAMDSNSDGKVTAAEMEAAHRAIAGGDAAKDELSAAEKIKAVDQDGDGILTAAEHAHASRAMFDKMDANYDGALTPQEMAAGHAAMLKK